MYIIAASYMPLAVFRISPRETADGIYEKESRGSEKLPELQGVGAEDLVPCRVVEFIVVELHDLTSGVLVGPIGGENNAVGTCLLYTSPSPRDS